MTDGSVIDGRECVDAGVKGKLPRGDLVLAEMERGAGRLRAGTGARTSGEGQCRGHRNRLEEMSRRPEGGNRPPAHGGGDEH